MFSFRLLYWITRCYCSKANKSMYLDEIGGFFGKRVLPIGTQSVFQSNWDISIFQVFFLRKPSLKLLSFPKSPKFLERFWKKIVQRPSSFFSFRSFFHSPLNLVWVLPLCKVSCSDAQIKRLPNRANSTDYRWCWLKHVSQTTIFTSII